MLLELAVVSYHRLSPRQSSIKVFDGTLATIGRSENADWHLPDPERIVSAIHAKIHRTNDIFIITDYSTNGLYVNGSVNALGRHESHELEKGDFLTLGDYQIEVKSIRNTDKKSFKTDHNSPCIEDESKPSKSVVELDTSASEYPFYVSEALDEGFNIPHLKIPEEWNEQIDSNYLEPIEKTETATDKVHYEKAGEKSIERADSHEDAFLRGLGLTRHDFAESLDDIWWEETGLAFKESLEGMRGIIKRRIAANRLLQANQSALLQYNDPLLLSLSAEDIVIKILRCNKEKSVSTRSYVKSLLVDVENHEQKTFESLIGSIETLLAEIEPDKIESNVELESSNTLFKRHKIAVRCWLEYRKKHTGLKNIIRTSLL